MRRGVHDNRRDAETQRERETLPSCLSLCGRLKHSKTPLKSPLVQGGTAFSSNVASQSSMKISSDFRKSDSIFQNVLRRERSWMISLCLLVSAVTLVAALTPLFAFRVHAAEPDSPPLPQLRVITLADAVSFKMGRIEGKRMVYPDMGAKRLTFNYIESQPGDEFPQHVHDYSDDTFLVLQGQVDVRQGDSRRHLGTGHAAFVPNGQIHGTITTGTAKALLISFQAPPDLKLYSGERDSSKPGAKPPVGVITPGAVQLLEFQNKNGFFLHRGLGSQRVAVAYRTLKPAEEFQADLPVSGEGLLFVWKGGVTVQQGQSRHRLEATNLLFATNAGKVLVKNTTAAPSILVQVQSPPDGSQAK